MLILTTKGELDESQLIKTETVDGSNNPNSIITEYTLNGEVVRRDVSLVLQTAHTTSNIGKF